MKNILRLMGALALTAGATPSVVACGNNGSNIPNNPQLNGKYAELLGWYSDENTSIIDEVINFDNLGTCIITADSTNLIKDKLEWQPFLGLFFGRHLFLIINWS
ncbi:hypothetical protein [Spiroplasma endosymbiont of Tricholauxania praeusta]|uniref:hypothetical protein n=1 Tax=Spiroplasma endosymbiont of Tricholauxania praeusta TaxID=3066296 RepID=UPI0030D3725A